jgi:hypothetical protein
MFLYLKTSSTPAVTDLFQDLRDGVVLLRLLEVLTGNEYVCKKNPKKKKNFYYYFSRKEKLVKCVYII